MFNALQTVVEGYDKTAETYRADVWKIQNDDYISHDGKEAKISAMNEPLFTAKNKAHTKAMELLDEQEKIFSAEEVDTSFILQAKQLGKTMPLQALSQFLKKHRGDFHTIEALSGLYKAEGKPFSGELTERKALIDSYKLKQELTGLPTKYFTPAEYLDDMRTVLNNFFGSTNTMPSAMHYSNFTMKITLNHVYAAMNIGKEAVGEKPITMVRNDTINFKQKTEVPVENTMGLSFKGVR